MDIFWIVVGDGGYILAVGGLLLMVVDIFWLVVSGGGWWWIYFGWWRLVVDLFWLFEGGSGWQWVVAWFSLTHIFTLKFILIGLFIRLIGLVKFRLASSPKWCALEHFIAVVYGPLIYVRNKWLPKTLVKTICWGVLLAITDTERKAVIS